MPDWRISNPKPSQADAVATCGELLSVEEKSSERIVRRTVRGILEWPHRSWRRTPVGDAAAKQTQQTASIKADIADLRQTPDLGNTVAAIVVAD
jgi:hypothetical protein